MQDERNRKKEEGGNSFDVLLGHETYEEKFTTLSLSKSNVIGTLNLLKVAIKLKKVISLFFKHYGLNWKKYTILNKKYYRSFEIKENYADTKKIRNNLKWKPKFTYLDIIKKLINKEI